MGRAGKQLGRIRDEPAAHFYRRYQELIAKRDRESFGHDEPAHQELIHTTEAVGFHAIESRLPFRQSPRPPIAGSVERQLHLDDQARVGVSRDHAAPVQLDGPAGDRQPETEAAARAFS